MWGSKLLLLALAGVAVLACDRTPSPVQTPVPAPSAALLQNTWFPVQSDYQTCSGDVLSLVGQGHFTTVERYNEAGKYQTRLQLNLKGTATGPDGSVYNVSASSVHLINDPPTAGMEVTWLDRVKLTGKGPAANESFYYWFGVTLNANGEITSLRDRCSLSCLDLQAEMVACL